MKVEVDADRCRGHGICLTICPEVFTLTDDGYAEAVAEVDPGFEAAVREAERGCPERAIVLG
ncbi:ferredoxin [Nocardia sp. CA2R105]|uniref:ferredoxin n=1 Tax=Nocardia coffeae TaxID=2873381 RepID=UPI001CA6AEB8|nr:ferredoxin [Nocardia coffeae]MBY8861027.1 ferredoxin [Nocardia coffeae]